MSTEPTDEELGLDPQMMEGLDPNIRKTLRDNKKLRREIDRLQAEAQQTKKEQAFREAGFPDSPLGRQLVKSYTGDLSSDAIKEYGEDMGILNQEPPQPTATPRDAELERLRQMQMTGNSAPTPDAMKDFRMAVRQAKNQAEVEAAILQYGDGVNVGLKVAD